MNPPLAADAAHPELSQLKARIAQVWARREDLKKALECGDSRPRSGLRALEVTDRELAELDLRFKALWDAVTASGAARPHPAAVWAGATAFEPIHLDCVTAIMLKILDGKCKLGEARQLALSAIYDVVKARPGQGLGGEVHALIDAARRNTDATLAAAIHDWRLRAEAQIPKPVMKGFKQLLRAALPEA